MNEVEELSKVDVKSLPPLRPILLNDLHQKVLKNLYLEVGTGPVLYLLSPSYSVITPTPNETINDFLSKSENLLDYVKEYIVQNLAVYSVLLDVNSYFAEQNNYLVLARLRERDSGGRRYEIKFYTHSPRELMTNYKDKIYIGRDFIDLFHFRRKYLGVKDLVSSVKDQNEVLLDKAEEKLKEPLEYKSFFQEMKESVNELRTESLSILQSLPPYLDFDKLKNKEYGLFYSHGGGGKVVTALESLAKHLGTKVTKTVESRGEPSAEVLDQCRKLGAELACKVK